MEVFKFSSDSAVESANVRCRDVASQEWRRIVPVLEIAAGIGEVDYTTVKDTCVCVARLDQAERDLSERGLMVTAERGTVKNGSATIAAQYRTQLARYIRELGLSPSSRAAITAPEFDDDDDDVFD
ncbi:phage terminase small subunit P27 family [Streptomyces sp. NPDC127068]|uniref:phage terminase small subunit P27 family n=1 Tax=Streptomyces sp. NPDC127068 TaxID=3347127 RepID=UPI00365F173F